MACECECECGSVWVRARCACVRASVCECVCEQISTCYIPDGDGSTTTCNTLEIAVECVELLDCVQRSRHAFSACSVQLHAPLAPQNDRPRRLRGGEKSSRQETRNFFLSMHRDSVYLLGNWILFQHGCSGDQSWHAYILRAPMRIALEGDTRICIFLLALSCIDASGHPTARYAFTGKFGGVFLFRLQDAEM